MNKPEIKATLDLNDKEFCKSIIIGWQIGQDERIGSVLPISEKTSLSAQGAIDSIFESGNWIKEICLEQNGVVTMVFTYKHSLNQCIIQNNGEYNFAFVEHLPTFRV